MKMNALKNAILYIILAALGLGAVLRIIHYQFVNPPEPLMRTARETTIPAKRGSLLATDGRYLAFSLTEYNIGLDCTIASDSLFNATVKPLSECLAGYLKERTAAEYETLLKNGRKNEKQYVELTKKSLSFNEKERVCTFPLLEKSPFVGGISITECRARQYPYKSLAYRTLGQIKEIKKDMVGIEKSRDSILTGKDGKLYERRTEHKRWVKDSDRPNTEPVNGTDIRTTIDIDIQEISERALRRQIAKSDDFQYGTVIVMETATGYIRAMVNLVRADDGKYYESDNIATSRLGEPGSVFKLATLTLLLDEGKVTLDTTFPAPKELKFGKAKPMHDKYLDKYTTISILRGFEISSNNVFKKLAWDNYHKNPQEFIDKLNNKLRITCRFDFDIAGLGEAYIVHPGLKNSRGRSLWSDTDLPQIAMGYASYVTPLHIVNFYNAVANGGMMVRPRLIESYEKDGVVLEHFGTEEIGRVCSERTARELHRAMRGVITEPGATGERVFSGCKVAVAGKTGTAQIGYSKKTGKKQHRASFAGFFPYENPKYTVIAVLVSNPCNKDYYGATWAGPVVREIAEEIYSINPDWGTQCPEAGRLPEPDGSRSLRKNIVSYEEQGYTVTAAGHGNFTEGKIDSLKEGVTLIMQ